MACAIAAVALTLVALVHKTSRVLLPLVVLVGAPTIAGLAFSDPRLRLGLFELGALLTVALVWQSARKLPAKLTYLAVVLISASSLIASELLAKHGQAEWAHALLLTSVCVKLAAVPLFFWLLSLADELPSVVLGLIIAVVDMAAFGEFWSLLNRFPLTSPTTFCCLARLLQPRSSLLC